MQTTTVIWNEILGQARMFTCLHVYGTHQIQEPRINKCVFSLFVAKNTRTGTGPNTFNNEYLWNNHQTSHMKFMRVFRSWNMKVENSNIVFWCLCQYENIFYVVKVMLWKAYLQIVDTKSETSWEKENINIYKIAWLHKYYTFTSFNIQICIYHIHIYLFKLFRLCILIVISQYHTTHRHRI